MVDSHREIIDDQKTKEESLQILKVVNTKELELENLKYDYELLEKKYKDEYAAFKDTKFLVGEKNKKSGEKTAQALLDFLKKSRWSYLEALDLISTNDLLHNSLKELNDNKTDALYIDPRSIDLIMKLLNRYSDVGITSAIQFTKLIYAIDKTLNEVGPEKEKLQKLEKEAQEAFNSYTSAKHGIEVEQNKKPEINDRQQTE